MVKLSEKVIIYKVMFEFLKHFPGFSCYFQIVINPYKTPFIFAYKESGRIR